MKNLRRIFRFVIPYWGHALLNILFNVMSVIFSLFSLTMVIPFLQVLFGLEEKYSVATTAPELSFSREGLLDYFYYVIGDFIESQDKLTSLMMICFLVVILFFLKNLFRYLAMFFLSPVRNGVVRDMRNSIFYKITILPLSYFSEKRKGDVLARVTNDVTEVEWSIMSSLEMIFREPISIILFMLTLFMLSPTLTLFVLILLPITGIIIGRIGKSLKRSSQKVQKQMGVLLSAIEETISGLRIIKAFKAIGFSNKKFKEINQEYYKQSVRVYRKRDLASPMSEFLATLVVTVVMFYGGKQVLDPGKSFDAELFIMYILIFSQLIQPAKAFTQAFYNIQKGIAAADRIEEILSAEEVIEEKENADSIQNFQQSLEYDDVHFTYENEPVLKGIKLKVEMGKTIALVGPSGAGKSTLVDLLPRFYDVVGGRILLDGKDIRDYVIDDLRGLMGVVTQESILFNDTVFGNIAFGNEEASLDDVIAAAKVANAHEFIEQMEDGYQTNIGDRGVKLSGGQRQRLSIARAVLKNPPILILDEATSSLDTESERLVQDALEKLMKNRTSVVIAHRLSTIQFADEIVVLEKGEIVERGRHEELLEKAGLYKKLYDLQSFS